MEIVSESMCFGGVQGVYSHKSKATGVEMKFGLFLPEEAKDGPVPVLWFLAGLTCTHENAMIKAGAQIHAAANGLALVYPDTSPRGEGVANDEAFDLGQGAGFYVDATEKPWAPHFNMYTYVTEELPALIGENFAVDMDRQGITGHSMGGHGALTLGMTRPGQYRSVSAFSPICHPTQSDWGKKQFTAYMGSIEAGEGHDATLLMRDVGFDGPMLIDTGSEDEWASYLNTEQLAEAVAENGRSVTMRMQPGYDHSYFFVTSFLADHLEFHARALKA